MTGVRGEYAPWSRRVVAMLLDSAVLCALLFVATGREPGATVLPGIGDAAWTGDGDLPWGMGTLVVMGLLQAWTGSTPGKRAVGIAVVDATTGRPAGVLTTVLRWLAHVLDLLLLVGYLRPLWDQQSRTFADSLLHTVVVRRAPVATVVTAVPPVLPVRPASLVLPDLPVLPSVPEPPTLPPPVAPVLTPPWERWRGRAKRQPGWARRAPGAAAVTVCTVSAALCLLSSEASHIDTSPPVDACADGRATATFGSSDLETTSSRLGLRRTTEEDRQVVVAWTLPDGGQDADGDWTAEVFVRAPDGTVSSSLHSSGDSTSAGDPWWDITAPVTTASTRVPADPAGWSATATLRDGDGSVVARCTAPVPAITAA